LHKQPLIVTQSSFIKRSCIKQRTKDEQKHHPGSERKQINN